MTPLEERYRTKLELFKKQKTGIAKDENITKRLEKLKGHNDFKQQIQGEFTKVEVDRGKLRSKNLRTGNERGFRFRTEKNRVLYNDKPKFSWSQDPGKIKILSQGRRWTTSGYQSFNTELSTDPQKVKKVEPKRKRSLKDRLTSAMLASSVVDYSGGRR